MKKQVLMIAIAAVALFTACQQNKGEQAASKSETKTTWTKIEPQDIENPIHLFAERHVAIATGKGDSVNAMTVSHGIVLANFGVAQSSASISPVAATPMNC